MHQALRISEILSAIFAYVAQPDLAKAVVVCKAWFVPAAEVLWEQYCGRHPPKPSVLGLIGERVTSGDGAWVSSKKEKNLRGAEIVDANRFRSLLNLLRRRCGIGFASTSQMFGS